VTSLEDRVARTLVTVAPFDLDPAAITPASWLRDSVDGSRDPLGLDSLSLLEAIALLDDDLGVDLLSGDDVVLLTVGDLIRGYQRRLGVAAHQPENETPREEGRPDGS